MSKSNAWKPKESLAQTHVTYNNQSYNNISQNMLPKELKQIRFRGSVTSGISED